MLFAWTQQSWFRNDLSPSVPNTPQTNHLQLSATSWYHLQHKTYLQKWEEHAGQFTLRLSWQSLWLEILFCVSLLAAWIWPRTRDEEAVNDFRPRARAESLYHSQAGFGKAVVWAFHLWKSCWACSCSSYQIFREESYDIGLRKSSELVRLERVFILCHFAQDKSYLQAT